jgi:hypothetical protein
MASLSDSHFSSMTPPAMPASGYFIIFNDSPEPNPGRAKRCRV